MNNLGVSLTPYNSSGSGGQKSSKNNANGGTTANNATYSKPSNKTPSMSRQSYASIDRSSDVAGSSPARRVWVKKIDGNPTTIIVTPDDIVDDLKQYISNKFPNSIARFVDPAEVLIKMDLLSRSSSNSSASAQLHPGQKKDTSPMLANSADTNTIKQLAHSHAQHFSSSYINLEPDQNVWGILDYYYPNGMTMQEAFLIEFPGDHQKSSLSQSISRPKYSPSHPSIYNNSPSSVQRSHSPIYHHPKPQSYHKSSAYPPNIPNPLQESSVSPSTINGRSSPSISNIHKRSFSYIPPHSPSMSSFSYASNNSSGSSQPVLLIPKNFSLATGAAKNPNVGLYSKRFSVDDNLVHKAGNGSGVPRKSVSGSNLTSIGIGNEARQSLNSNSATATLHGEGDREVNNDHPPIISRNSNEPDSPMNANNDKDRTLTRTSDSLKDEGTKNNDQHSMVPAHIIPDKADNPRHLNGVEVSALPNKSLRNLDYSKLQSNLPKSSKEDNKPNTEALLPSISVLVVEDNAINQAILGAFLRKHRISYQIAKNGQEAIDKWRSGGFHLVLMDIQLPVKSGIEATKEIRHLEKINRIGVFAQHELKNTSKNETVNESEKLDLNLFRSPVIIVALTASSNSSVDKTNALRAGCNDFLTKPVNLVWLQNKITEWGCMQALIDFDGWKVKRSIEK
ncbi:Piso0_005016 [Millerozyma farinosa CBS 7064]|uniref:Piso0_005016 protein n=1 Tax=Pichia sorbitophila (strain ATCC MYA-4447 / BCRC 22081 / CBS 7064 / NBRC 10061 / NRRL Y-12695) TaxID=559304 RepID=G8Y402_PICSO|nr:Piso0_005016 [Millerozyma farinosa CBS 7064]